MLRRHLCTRRPHPHTYSVSSVSHPYELVPQLLFDILALTEQKKFDI